MPRKELNSCNTVSFRLPKDTPTEILQYLVEKKENEERFGGWCYQIFKNGLEFQMKKEGKKQGANYNIEFPSDFILDDSEWLYSDQTRKMVGKIVYDILTNGKLPTVNTQEIKVDNSQIVQQLSMINQSIKQLNVKLEQNSNSYNLRNLEEELKELNSKLATISSIVPFETMNEVSSAVIDEPIVSSSINEMKNSLDELKNLEQASKYVLGLKEDEDY